MQAKNHANGDRRPEPFPVLSYSHLLFSWTLGPLPPMPAGVGLPGTLPSPVMALDSSASTPLLVMAPGESKLCLRVAESVAFRKSGLPLEGVIWDDVARAAAASGDCCASGWLPRTVSRPAESGEPWREPLTLRGVLLERA
jgi:hypothetical protein